MASRKQLISTLRTGYYANPKKSYGQIQTERFNAPNIGRSYKYRGDRQATRRQLEWRAQRYRQYAQRHGLKVPSRAGARRILESQDIFRLEQSLKKTGYDIDVNKDNAGHLGHLWNLAHSYDEKKYLQTMELIMKTEQLSQGNIVINTINDVYNLYHSKLW